MRIISLSLLMASCAVVAGCGNAERKARPEPPDLAQSIRLKRPGSSARFFERTVYGNAGGRFDETLRGAFDWSRKVGWAARNGATGLQLIQIGSRCYERWPPGVWRERVASDVDGLCNADIFDNPATAFDLFSSVGGLTRVGRSLVNGVATTHYRVQLNLGAVRGPLDLWVDDYRVLRRSRQQGESSRDFLGIRDYRDFGVEVHVRAPRGTRTKLEELIKGDG